VLSIEIKLAEGYDESAEEFVSAESVVVNLEHSLVSLSKWESKWEIPFLAYEDKTTEQTLDYIRMMILGPIPPESVLSHFSARDLKEIHDYIESKQTATWINDNTPPSRNETITAEIIYYWMISLNIPLKCEEWHLNRLLTLIRVCNIKNNPDRQKMSRAESGMQQSRLNEERKKQMKTTG
jgi:hypothetical protein